MTAGPSGRVSPTDHEPLISHRKVRNDAWLTIRERVMTECHKEYTVEQLIKKFKNIQFSIKSKLRDAGEGGKVSLGPCRNLGKMTILCFVKKPCFL